MNTMLYCGIIVIVLFVVNLEYVSAGEWCNTQWCEYDCCGDNCCPYKLMTLIGAIFSGLVFIITVVVCIVCIYCVCKRNKQRRATGSTVVQPTNTNIVYVNNSAYAHPPPSYNQYGVFPDTSSSRQLAYSYPAYPPGTVNSAFNGGHPPPAYKL